jgi:ribonuclease Y
VKLDAFCFSLDNAVIGDTMVEMSYKDLVFLIAGCLSLGFIFGYFFRIIMALARKNSIELEIKKLSVQAEEKGQHIILKAEEKAAHILDSSKQQLQKKESFIQEEQLRIQQEISRIQQKESAIDRQKADLDTEIRHAKSKIEDIQRIKAEIDEKNKNAEDALIKTSSLTHEEAKQELLNRIENDEADILSDRIRKLELYGEEKLAEKARGIMAIAIQRLAAPVNQEHFVTTIPVESDEVKGKIIGKEGRNIKAFERETGVEVLVDEAPNSITISSFDPIRRFIAREALVELIRDGRIQPAKIEKVVADIKADVLKLAKEKGEKAVYEAGIPNLDPRIVQILGRLHFRTSYGQNVLQHSIECAHIAGMLAEEIGANVRISRAGALLHDIGKALDHEVTGSHVEIGRQVLQKFGMEEAVIKAMQAHHEEYPYETIESRIVQTADAISGSRPGARNNSVEFYIKRLDDLENIALRQRGVEKVFALQAGRELRVFVRADQVSDSEAKNIAKIIAKDIEHNLKYPGEIKVTVIREMRIIETAR